LDIDVVVQEFCRIFVYNMGYLELWHAVAIIIVVVVVALGNSLDVKGYSDCWEVGGAMDGLRCIFVHTVAVKSLGRWRIVVVVLVLTLGRSGVGFFAVAVTAVAITAIRSIAIAVGIFSICFIAITFDLVTAFCQLGEASVRPFQNYLLVALPVLGQGV
jgi:hypothetical protein